ncbi:MAG: phospholipase D-like domain-containing protein [Bacteroidota bacterium]
MKNYCQAESVKLIHHGKTYFAELERLIAEAKEVIHLQVYILEEDETGRQVIASLKQAAHRGVKVFLLADGFGSKGLSRKTKNEMLQSGIRFRLFSPLFSSESIFLGRRLHHKIVVADRRTAMVGGINISDKYRGTANERAWLDYAVRINGEVCGYLHLLCERIFHRRSYKRIVDYPCPSGLAGGVNVRFRRNDWIIGKTDTYLSYKNAFAMAERSIIIAGSYFLPGHSLRRAMKRAVRRGVRIKVILAGKSDLPFFRLAEKYLYNFLTRNKVEVYEWHDSVMHGKAIVVDSKWASVGSYNVNYLSRYWSIELNADIDNRDFAETFHRHLEEVMNTRCRKITWKSLHRGILTRFWHWIAYQYYKWLLRLLLPIKSRGNIRE